MRYLTVLALFLALAGLLLLSACAGQTTTANCFGPRPVSSVHSAGKYVKFTVTTIRGTFTFGVPKSAFGGAPAAMKDGDLVTFCADTVNGTTTISEFSDQGQPAATGTPLSR